MGEPERALVFDCHGERLVGVLSPGRASTGLVVVVGGPQYRVGSHRQFVQLARTVSGAGFPVLRFDYRGMGDSEGALLGFEHVAEDIRVAVDALMENAPGVSRVVLWGLCDAASAAALYAPTDARVSGVVLLNPWVRSERTEAAARLRHYYLARLVSPALWRRVIAGEVRVGRSLVELGGTVIRAARGKGEAASAPVAAPAPGSAGFADAAPCRPPETRPDLAGRMASALSAFGGRVLLVTSGDDLTAQEFLDVAGASEEWRSVLSRPCVERRHIAEANHTFARTDWKEQVAEWTRRCLADP